MQANFKVVLIYVISLLNHCILKPNLIFSKIFIGPSRTPYNVSMDPKESADPSLRTPDLKRVLFTALRNYPQSRLRIGLKETSGVDQRSYATNAVQSDAFSLLRS